MPLWKHFAPKKFSNFYSTNGDGNDRTINLIFIDIDRTDLLPSKYLEVTTSLIQIKSVKNIEFIGQVHHSTSAVFSGYLNHLNSIHPICNIIEESLSPSWTDEWARSVKKVNFRVWGGREK